jgi:DNA uptake protein ComE-like DNA-binding protein
MITILLLIAITWILWNIQQNLAESNDRQRNVAESLEKLVITLSDTESVTGTSNNAKTTKTSAISPSTEKIGLNSASKGTLRKLPKVGAIVAERIIEARPFSHLEQLKKVDGMTENLFLSLEHLISLD